MTTQPKKKYLAQAASESLTPFGKRSWALYQRTPYERAPAQAGADLIDAYDQARRLVSTFTNQIEICAEAVRAGHRVRPGGVKDANRTVEKMSGRQKALPLDLLAGTLVCSSVAQMYDVAESVPKYFEVVSFRDRCIAPVRPSGYRDLQLTVRLDGHIAEVKILHKTIADLDQYEHKIFEIQRRIEAEHRRGMPFVEELVADTLTWASQQMYSEAWKATLASEGLLPSREDSHND